MLFLSTVSWVSDTQKFLKYMHSTTCKSSTDTVFCGGQTDLQNDFSLASSKLMWIWTLLNSHTYRCPPRIPSDGQSLLLFSEQRVRCRKSAGVECEEMCACVCVGGLNTLTAVTGE